MAAMRRGGEVAPNLICYNAGISACGEGWAWERALGLLGEMRARGVPPAVYLGEAYINLQELLSERRDVSPSDPLTLLGSSVDEQVRHVCMEF